MCGLNILPFLKHKSVAMTKVDVPNMVMTLIYEKYAVKCVQNELDYMLKIKSTKLGSIVTIIRKEGGGGGSLI